MSLGRAVTAQPFFNAGHARLPYLRATFLGACGKESDEVRHVPAAYQQAATISGIADKLGDPADRLSLDLGCRGREYPCPDIRIRNGGTEVAERSDRSGARRDVAQEPWMRLEEGMVQHQL